MGTEKPIKITLGTPWDGLQARFAAVGPPGPHFKRFFIDLLTILGLLWGALRDLFRQPSVNFSQKSGSGHAFEWFF